MTFGLCCKFQLLSLPSLVHHQTMHCIVYIQNAHWDSNLSEYTNETTHTVYPHKLPTQTNHTDHQYRQTIETTYTDYLNRLPIQTTHKNFPYRLPIPIIHTDHLNRPSNETIHWDYPMKLQCCLIENQKSKFSVVYRITLIWKNPYQKCW